MQKLKFKIKNYRKWFTTFSLHERGFTLIELLVVMAIIGILSSFLLANFVGVRQRARDGVRKSDLRQIQAALELYRADQGYYPAPGASSGDFKSCGNSLTDVAGSVTYMQKIPCDPLNSGSYTYNYYPSPSPASSYFLIACLENVNDSQKDSVNNALCSMGGWSYTLQDP